MIARSTPEGRGFEGEKKLGPKREFTTALKHRFSGLDNHFAPSEIKDAKLAVIQNRCLRVMAGAYLPGNTH